MSNGRHALKGFEYQATINLDLLLRHFLQTDDTVEICPEGEDDLVVVPINGGSIHYYQVKKPKEFDNGDLKNEPWSLVDIVEDLLPGTFDRLSGNQHLQTWILGDDVNPDVHSLLNDGRAALVNSTDPYLQTLHRLARNRSKIIPKQQPNRGLLLRWTPANDATIDSLKDSFRQEAILRGVQLDDCDAYEQVVNEIHTQLPDVLERTIVETMYGAEEEIRDRIQQALMIQYGLDWDTTKRTLVPGLRNFIYGVSSKIGKIITKIDFEGEIRNIWPRMTMVCTPPPLGAEGLRRGDLILTVLDRAGQGPLEITGISGSGKSTLSSELLEYLENHEPEVISYYVAAKLGRSFRDVVAGISFQLRSFGMEEIFGIATGYTASDEQVLQEIAEQLSSSEHRIVVIVDLVDGACTDEFANELARFLENLTGNTFRLIVMGQESSFRMLTQLQRNALGHPECLDLPGFNFDEFVGLTKILNGNPPDRDDLWDIYNRLAAGRISGLHARLANSIASCESLQEMSRLAHMPSTDVLQEVDRVRYSHISDDLKEAAGNLLCFMLPFQENEAINLFPSDRIKSAIRELIRQGLLRSLGNERFEFHETVRRGLEQMLPPDHSKLAHQSLAQHYLQRKEVTAAIYHLEEAGEIEDAKQIARKAFLEGTSRGELEAYVSKHQLLSAYDIIDLLDGTADAGAYYMLPQMLKKSGQNDVADMLLQLVRRKSGRFDKDYRWAWSMTEAVLVCDPSKLFELVVFGLEAPTKETEQDRLQYIIQGVRHPIVPIVDSRLLAYFNRQSDPVKKRLVPLFLKDKRRETLAPALSFLSTYETHKARQGRWGDSWMRGIIKLGTPEDIREFLAAFPLPENDSLMLVRKTVLLGKLEGLVWSERQILRPQCIEILEDLSNEEDLLFNAMRVLVFLQDARAIDLSEKVDYKSGRLKTFAGFVPSFYPHIINPEIYRTRVLNLQLPLEDRIVAYMIYCRLGEDIDQILAELKAIDTASAGAWDRLAVMNSAQHPCKSAMLAFEKMLEELPTTDKSKPKPYLPVISKLGELPGEDVTDFLIRMLENNCPEISLMACMALGQRRSKHALPKLLNLCQEDVDPGLAQNALVAAIASGPSDAESFANIWSQYPNSAIWRCILIGRVGDLSEADWLIEVTTDTAQHWQVRRAAVLAASRLPFDTALEKIYPSVIKELSPFTIDIHPSLLMHNLLTPLILDERDGLMRFFRRGKGPFVKFWGEIFQTWAQGANWPVSEQAGAESAAWLFNRFEFHGWPDNQSAQDTILNELHIPIIQAATLRGIRLTGQLDLIESLLAESNTEWLHMRTVCEWAKHPEHTQEDIDRLVDIVGKGAFSSSVSAKNCLNDLSRRKSRPTKPKRNEASTVSTSTTLAYDDIINALEIGQLPGAAPYVLEGLTEDQFSKLTKELNPRQDYKSRLVSTDPKLAFSTSGPSVKGVKHESVETHKNVREALRPALSAVNSFGHHISWHSNLLAGGNGHHEHVAQQYMSAFLASVAVLGDSSRFYDELEVNSDLIIPRLGNIACREPLKSFIDRRIIPSLRVYANAGTDDTLESLCTLALCVEDDSIDQVLSELFLRWCHRFERGDKPIQHQGNSPLWRAFNSMKKHPRFCNIPDYDLRLLEILNCRLYWSDRDNIITAVSESPRSYTKIEAMLMRAAPFEHFLWDEVDRLDNIAQKLFKQSSD
jgi:hypothetical protein